jgi:hypothetical protein
MLPHRPVRRAYPGELIVFLSPLKVEDLVINRLKVGMIRMAAYV